MAGFEVLEAMDGAGGISQSQKERPDAIVMDLRLPDMRGDVVAKNLRQEIETSDTPIIFVTASVVKEVLVGNNAIPRTLVLSKPINTRTFAKEISQFMGEAL